MLEKEKGWIARYIYYFFYREMNKQMGCGGVIVFLVLFVALVECNSRGSNFRQCCAQGKEASTYGSGSCTDFSRLNDKSTSCKFAYTICCSQNKRTSECEKGKRHALAGHRCDDLQGRSDCDSLTVSAQSERES